MNTKHLTFRRTPRQVCLIFIITSVIWFFQLNAQTSTLPGSGNAFELTGNATYTEINNFDVLEVPATIMVWVKYIPGQTTQTIFASDPTLGAGYHGFFLDVNTNQIVGIHTGSSGCFSPQCRQSLRVPFPPEKIGKWMHIAAVVEAPGVYRMYFDGVLVNHLGFNDGNGPLQVAYNPNPQPFIGATYFHNQLHFPFEGSIDELSIWKRALSENEIRTYVCKKIDPTSANDLYAYYNFDILNTSQMLPDISGNNRNGAFQGTGSIISSGAYIGDESSYSYSAGDVQHSNSAGDFVKVTQRSTQSPGVQIFSVLEAPNHKNGIAQDSTCMNDRYNGVYFCMETSNNTGSEIQAKVNSQNTLDAFKRENNASNVWSQSSSGFSQNDSLNFTLLESMEFILLPDGTEYYSGLPDTFYSCNYPETITANSFNGSIVWSDSTLGNQFEAPIPGWYYLKIFGGCLMDTINDSIFIGSFITEIDTTAIICDGESVEIGNEIFYYPGAFVITIPDDLGCDTTYYLQLIDDCLIVENIPNVFTPNGDGKNDIFFINARGVYEFDLLIYNRWGMLMYSTNQIEQGWDGTVNGRPAAGGVYFIKAKIVGRNETIDHQGTVHLFR